MKDWLDLIRRGLRPDTVPVLIALIVGIVALVTPAFGDVTTGRALQLIMVVLVGIILSLGIDRIWRFWNMENSLSEISRSLTEIGNPGADSVLGKRDDSNFMNEFGARAKSLLAIGITLKSLADRQGFLEDLLKAGATIRLVIRHGDEAEELAKSFREPPNKWKSNRKTSKDIFEFLKKEAEVNAWPGKIHLRELGSTPRMTITVIDGFEKTGRMQIELLPYGKGLTNRPVLRLARDDQNPGWYESFLESCEALWSDAHPVF